MTASNCCTKSCNWSKNDDQAINRSCLPPRMCKRDYEGTNAVPWPSKPKTIQAQWYLVATRFALGKGSKIDCSWSKDQTFTATTKNWDFVENTIPHNLVTWIHTIDQQSHPQTGWRIRKLSIFKYAHNSSNTLEKKHIILIYHVLYTNVCKINVIDISNHWNRRHYPPTLSHLHKSSLFPHQSNTLVAMRRWDWTCRCIHINFVTSIIGRRNPTLQWRAPGVTEA